MTTTILTKEQFIEQITKSVKDDEFVLLCNNATNFEFKKRLNTKRVSFDIAADAFKNEGVGDFLHGNVSAFSISLCKKDALSDLALSLIKEKV